MDNSKEWTDQGVSSPIEEKIEKQNYTKEGLAKTESQLEDNYLSDNKRSELESKVQEHLDEQNMLTQMSKKEPTSDSANKQTEFESEVQGYFDKTKLLREKVTKDAASDSVNKQTEFESEVQGYFDEEKMLREQQRMLEEQSRKDAINNARKRYAEKSLLYKFFHKKLSDKKAEEMTTSEINKLYDGVEEEKGISR